MPDYAEVAGCSSFKNATSPNYESCGAYATTTLIGHGHQNYQYSAPNSCYYNNYNQTTDHSPPFVPPSNASNLKINIIENRMDMMNNLSQTNGGGGVGATSSVSLSKGHTGLGNGKANGGHSGLGGLSHSVPHTPVFGTIKRNRYNKIGGYNSNGISNNINSNSSSSNNNNNSNNINDKNRINFGDNGRSLEQPLFIKSKYDGTWSSVQNSTSSLGNNINSYHVQSTNLDNHNNLSQNYLSSFGKSDNV